jgi:hypothetical protein
LWFEDVCIEMSGMLTSHPRVDLAVLPARSVSGTLPFDERSVGAKLVHGGTVGLRATTKILGNFWETCAETEVAEERTNKGGLLHGW